MKLAAANTETSESERFGERVLSFTDPDGLPLELIGTDESTDELGTHLKLPAQYEIIRADIERALPPLRMPGR